MRVRNVVGGVAVTALASLGSLAFGGMAGASSPLPPLPKLPVGILGGPGFTFYEVPGVTVMVEWAGVNGECVGIIPEDGGSAGDTACLLTVGHVDTLQIIENRTIVASIPLT